ncbi:hypothetical protein ACFVYT_24855 [Streptomyces sp. NPDC058290]|uniref:hypothetical protein n=1 Tax=Streptomyces sp. NPDC058290 TaxID=3346426 RepID=UPI0036E63DF9
MDVTGYHLSARYAKTLRLVGRVADQAATLVQQRMRERMPATSIQVVDGKRYLQALVEGQQAVLSTSRLPNRRSDPSVYGATTLSPTGVLILINAKACADPTNLVETVVHELVHSVQYGRPGNRENAIKGLRNNYGIEPMSWRGAWKINRIHDRDELEAQALEVLAREIR